MHPCPVPPTFRQALGCGQEEGKDQTPALRWHTKVQPCSPTPNHVTPCALLWLCFLVCEMG